MYKKFFLLSCLIFYSTALASDTNSSNSAVSVSDADLKKCDDFFRERMELEDVHWCLLNTDSSHKVPAEHQDFVAHRKDAQNHFLSKALARFDAMISSSKCYGHSGYEMTTYVALVGLKNEAGKKRVDIIVTNHSTPPTKLCFKQKKDNFTLKQKPSSDDEFQEFTHHFYLSPAQQKRSLPEQTEDQERFHALWSLILEPGKSTFDKAAPFLFPAKTPVKKGAKPSGDNGDKKSNA